MKLSSDQAAALDAIQTFAASGRVGIFTLAGLAGCLSGSTVVQYNRGKRINYRDITLRDFYLKFNGFDAPNVRGAGCRWSNLTEPTYMLSYWPDGSVAGNRVIAVFESGVKPVLRISFKDREPMILTADHPIATPTGKFTEAGRFRRGDSVLAKGTLHCGAGLGRRPISERPKRIIVNTRFHPLGAVKFVVCNGIVYRYIRVSRARLVVEAALNGIPYDEFVHALKRDEAAARKFKYIPRGFDVHHLDENTLNDTIENLSVLPRGDHARHHAQGATARFRKDYTRELIISEVKPIDEEMTYDVQMEPPANNFLADGVFVHNTGKTSLLGVFAKDQPGPIAFAAFTGRAASVLGRKLKDQGVITDPETFRVTPDGSVGNPRASYCGTLHRLMYKPIMKKMRWPDGSEYEIGPIGWTRRKELDRRYRLIVVDECFHPRQQILTEHGWQHIGHLVNAKIDCRVWSLNRTTGELELKPIVRWLKKPGPSKLLKIDVGRSDSHRSARVIRCTPDHKLLTPNGYVKAGSLKPKDCLVVKGRHLTPLQFSVLVGSMLGDGSMNRSGGRISPQPIFTHGEDQFDYLNFKRTIFGDLAGELQEGKSGYGNKPVWRFSLGITDQAYQVAAEMPFARKRNGRQYWAPTLKFLSWVDATALAVWFMDDGHVCRAASGRLTGAAFHTECFSKRTNNMLASMLKYRFGLAVSVRRSKGYYYYYYLKLGKRSAEKLLETIAPHSPKCMAWKVSGAVFSPANQPAGAVTVAPIRSIVSVAGTPNVFDIEVADNHNYIAGNVVVSNCSMVDQSLLEDLASFGVPILAVGDHGQLPPVMGKSAMRSPDVRLEKIHRQAEGNPIIALAHAVRSGSWLTREDAFGDNGGGVYFRAKRTIGKVLREAYSASGNPLDVGVICWTNKTRVWLNDVARSVRGLQNGKGEVMICLRNAAPIYNGMRGMLTEDVKPGPVDWTALVNIEFPEEGLPATPVEICGPQLGYPATFRDIDELREAGCDAQSMADAGSLYDWGYAMTCHKMQGSQLDHAIIYLDRPENPSSEDYRTFMYTAVTRAARRLTILV